jgi:hypothetical protein
MTALSRSAATAVSALPAAARGPRLTMHILLYAAVAAMMASAAFSVAHAQGWSTAQLSQARSGPAATSFGTVAVFAGGVDVDSDFLRILFLLCEGVLIAAARCVMGTCLLVFRVGVLERLLSYARHCRCWLFQCCGLVRLFRSCGLVRQRNRTMVDGSAQSGALLSFSDICWNGSHFRRGFFQ